VILKSGFYRVFLKNYSVGGSKAP